MKSMISSVGKIGREQNYISTLFLTIFFVKHASKKIKRRGREGGFDSGHLWQTTYWLIMAFLCIWRSPYVKISDTLN